MMFDPVSDVQGPVGALGWSVSTGWITDPDELMAEQNRDVVLIADDDAIVRDVEGDATIAAAMHLDRRITAVRREIDELREQLYDVAEAFTQRLSERA